jgi:hypothetical protein
MFTKYARVEGVLEVKTFNQRMAYAPSEQAGDRLLRFAAANDSKTDDGYLYVRCRAISSRVNKNNDGWPAEELAKSYKTFIGKPIFVDHNNEDPKRTRGVIVDAQLHVDDPEKTSALDPYYSSAPENHKPPTWIELLMEIDAKTYPKLAKAIQSGDMDAVSMGANIEKSICSVCANEAATPSEYCSHVKQKGMTFEITSDNGEKIRKKAYEDCYGVGFFEISNVFDPADETADSWLDSEKAAHLASRAEQEGLDADEVLAYVGLKNDGVLAKAASTGHPLTQDFINKLSVQEQGVSYPEDPETKDQVLALCRQIIEAYQSGDTQLEQQLKMQLSEILSPHMFTSNWKESVDIQSLYAALAAVGLVSLYGPDTVRSIARSLGRGEPPEEVARQVYDRGGGTFQPAPGVADNLDLDQLSSLLTYVYHSEGNDALYSSMQKGAPYPENSYKNAPDHSPKGQKKWPKEVNAIYNACMREGNGKGDTQDEKESSCAAIAWAQHNKGTKSKDSRVTFKRADSPKFMDAMRTLVQKGDYTEWPDDVRNRARGIHSETSPMWQHLDNVESVIGAIRRGDDATAHHMAEYLAQNEVLGNPWIGMNPRDIVEAIRGRQGSVKQSIPAEQFVQPSDSKTPSGQRDYEPQSDMTTAPQHVDTLRSETRCTICRAADMVTDPDGIMRCPTCGHVQEPEPVDNPDLSQARDVDLRQDSTDARSPEGDPQVPASNPLDTVEFSPMETTNPVAARKDSTTNEGISEMFKLKLRTSNKEEAVAVMRGAVKVARTSLKLGKNGIHRGIYDAARQAGLKVKVSYPEVDDDENYVEIPGDNGVFNLFFAQESAAKLKVPISEVPIVIEADTQETLDKFTDILANTERPKRVPRTAAGEKKPILPAGAKPSDEPKDATVVKDEHAPRETKTVTVTEDVVEMDGKKFHLVEVTDADDESTSEEKTEPVDTSKAEELAKEVTDEKEDDKESKLLAAFKIADMAVDLGLIASDSKMAFIAELEEDSLAELSARESTMKAVKTAGLSKSAKRVPGLKRVPRLSHHTVVANGSTPNDTPDEALFL